MAIHNVVVNSGGVGGGYSGDTIFVGIFTAKISPENPNFKP